MTTASGVTPTPGVNNSSEDPRFNSADSMQVGARDAVHYQPGVEMSAPLQALSDRGQARGDQAQSNLGQAANFAAGYGNQAALYGGKGYDAAQRGSDAAYQTAGSLAGAAGQGGAIGNQYAGQISKAGGYGMAEAARAQAGINDAAGRMSGAAGRLEGLEANQGPSAAQAQYRSAVNNAQGQNLAAMRSGGGYGGNAARTSQALRANAAMGQEAANQSAVLKAGEDAAWRQRQAANIGNAGGLYGGAGNLNAAAGGLGLSATGQNLQGQGMAGQQALAGNAQNIQGLDASGRMGLAGTQAALQGAQTGIAANQAGIQGMQAAGQIGATGYGLGFQGDTQAGQAIAQDQAAKQQYENMLTQQYGIESGVAIQNAQMQNAFTGGLISAGAGAGALMLSDEQRKDVGPKVKMSSALYGNPYGTRGAPGTLAGAASDDDEFSVMSDERNKRAPNLRDVESHLYEYKDPSMPGAAPGLQAGPMAQDIERAIPGAVRDTPTGKQVDAARTVLPLLSAVGEQQAEIDRLKRILDVEKEGRLADNSHLPKARRAG